MSELRFESAGVLGTGVLGALFMTTRLERRGWEHVTRLREAGQPMMFVCWHGDLVPFIRCLRQQGVVVLVSEHDDGEYVKRVLERNGFGTVRGSSTRGGTRGVRGLVRAARAGRDVAVTVDGPTGPPHVFKPGALAAAQMAGLPVVPMALRSAEGWRFRSWDRFLMPRPFSTLQVDFLEPRKVPRALSRDDLAALAAEIGDDLEAVRR